MRSFLSFIAIFVLGNVIFLDVFCAEIVPNKNAKLISIRWMKEDQFSKRYSSYFEDVVHKPWDALSLKIKIDQISRELINNGYLNSKVKTELAGSPSEIILEIVIEANERINFWFEGNKRFTYQELRNKFLEKIKNDFGKYDRQELVIFLKQIYEDVGVYSTEVDSYQLDGKDSLKSNIKNYYFKIKEGEKILLDQVNFHGNSLFKEAEIVSLMQSKASPLVSSGFYDKQFFEIFSETLKKEYLSRGFVFAEVSRPRITNNDEDDTVSVDYGISERQQVYIRNFDFKNLDSELASKIKSRLINKTGSPINVVELENDFKNVIALLQNEGYYFVTIPNLNSDKLLVYDKTQNYVDINVDVNLDKKICYNNISISGHDKTEKIVIEREVDLKLGELITPNKLDQIRVRLSGLGLFSSLRITPYMEYDNSISECANTKLVIHVEEKKEFNSGEVTAGYRTDLGAKTSVGITYGNIFGMNRSFSLKAQTNLRTNLDGFDDRRRRLNSKKFEYAVKGTFVEPYLMNHYLNTQVESELATSIQKKRFYGFDAKIFRFSPQLSKSIIVKDELTSWSYGGSLKYQYETIEQFDATISKDNDNFEIGGLTPTFTLDKRDDQFNPRKGYFSTLSSEWANPFFFSMKSDNLEVNFVKLINRNKFYYSLGNFTFAFSLALGYERNFATEVLRDSTTGSPILNSNGVPKTRGYIPSIKVFRLDGVDEIRGFDEGEINRLIGGTPIGDIVIQNQAYFSAFKFEPRYNITDNLQLGIFFDAGRVFVDSFQPFNLRTSTGISFKILTPVGSLDFDYGIKIKRQSYSDGKRDSSGRFHLSIGFF